MYEPCGMSGADLTAGVLPPLPPLPPCRPPFDFAPSFLPFSLRSKYSEYSFCSISPLPFACSTARSCRQVRVCRQSSAVRSRRRSAPLCSSIAVNTGDQKAAADESSRPHLLSNDEHRRRSRLAACTATVFTSADQDTKYCVPDGAGCSDNIQQAHDSSQQSVSVGRGL